MNRTRLASLAGALALAAVSALGLADAATAAPAAPRQLAVYELLSRERTHIYSVSAREIAGIRKQGFRLNRAPIGRVWTGPFRGSLTLYRLHLKNRSQWIVTHKAEADKLVAGGQWQLDGVLGYVAGFRMRGTRLLDRFNHRGGDHVIRPHGADRMMARAGWTKDGPLGYFG